MGDFSKLVSVYVFFNLIDIYLNALETYLTWLQTTKAGQTVYPRHTKNYNKLNVSIIVVISRSLKNNDII